MLFRKLGMTPKEKAELENAQARLEEERQMRQELEEAVVELAELYSEQDDALVELAELIAEV